MSSSPVDDGEPSGEDGEIQPSVAVGEYTWESFMLDHGYEEAAEAVFGGPTGTNSGAVGRFFGSTTENSAPEWEASEFDPEAYLGIPPEALPDHLAHGKARGRALRHHVAEWLRSTPVRKDEYTWEHFKQEYYYDEDWGTLDSGESRQFEKSEHLGFDPDELEDELARGKARGRKLQVIANRRTVDVDPAFDEDEFFSTVDGETTLVNRYDLEKAVSMEKKRYFREVDRYWVDKPYAFVIIFHSVKENEKKYYVVSPHLNDIESDLKAFLTRKLRTTIKYADDVVVQGTKSDRSEVIQRELHQLLDRYNLYSESSVERRSLMDRLRSMLSNGADDDDADDDGGFDGIAARPEPAVVAENPADLTEYQVAKLGYLLTRDFIGYERIDGIKHDVNVEDISCDGYNSPVFVYHTEYEQIISNISHGEEQLDDFVVKLAQRSGKSISKRHPQVDATLPDGSRAQLTLGHEVSAHGTNYTIRQFNDVPFTPIDLINWHTFSMEEMVYLWLCIENNKSLLFAGGTASGKTTSLNAVSLFVPSKAKIVSIEDTREVELPQRNWIASVTRPSFSHNDEGNVDEFSLLEAGLRQRPEYILMGEVRGEEGRTLFQVMSTGHTTLTTFHADSVGEVLKRFTTDPINVSKTMFTALDLVSVQTQTRIQGEKVRRNKSITEINHYETANDEINVRDIYTWRAEGDAFRQRGDSKLLEEIKFDRGWSQERLESETFQRRVILAYLIDNGIKEYAKVAATLQAFINDPETILALIARDRLDESLEDLREMESVLIDIDPEKEALVPRPDPGPETRALAETVLAEAEDTLFEEYRDRVPSPLVEALPEVEVERDVVVDESLLEGSADFASGPAEPKVDQATDGGIDQATDGGIEPEER